MHHIVSVYVYALLQLLFPSCQRTKVPCPLSNAHFLLIIILCEAVVLYNIGEHDQHFQKNPPRVVLPFIININILYMYSHWYRVNIFNKTVLCIGDKYHALF